MIEHDVETKALQWYAGGTVFLSQFLHPRGGVAMARHPRDQDLAEHHLTQDDGYRGWNYKFDLHGNRASGLPLPPEGKRHDGMVAAHIIDERYSVALQAKADKFNVPNASPETERAVKDWLSKEKASRRKQAKDEGTEFVPPNYSDVPWHLMEPYAAHDVLAQREVCDVIYPQIERNPEYRALYEMEMNVLDTLFAAECRGIPFDREALVGLEGDLLPKLDEHHEECVRIADFKPFNPGSPQQVSKALDRLGADTRYMTRNADNDILTVDEENLNACNHPLAESILAYRSQHKMYAMVRRLLHGKPGDDKFPAPYLTSEDTVHPNFRQVGARTGRMSCSNPNFQQIHRDDLRLRYCVAARPGKKLVCVDLEGIELRLLAAFAGEGPLLELFRRGDDPHQFVADMIGLQDRRRASGAIESARSRGKKWNYLKNYGGGVRAIRKWFQVNQNEARDMKNRYEAAFPEVKGLENRILYALLDKGYIKTPWGRRHRVYNVETADREAYMFIAYLLQGTAGDLFKDAAVKVHKQGVPLIAFVHDEFIAEVDESDSEEAAHVMVEALTNHPVIDAKVPLTADVNIVDRWSQAKDKLWTPDYLKESS